MYKKLVLRIFALILFSIFTLVLFRIFVLGQPEQTLSLEEISRPDTGPHYGLIYYSAKKNTPGDSGIEFGSLYLFDLYNKKSYELTQRKIVSRYDKFSWSPITNKLVYTAGGDDVFDENLLELYSSNLIGDQTQLTNNEYSDGDGFIAPNGRSIAFWSSRSDHYWLYLMNSDGSNIQPVFDQNTSPEFAFLPLSWSPDSQKLVIPIRHLEESTPINLNDINYDFGLIDIHSEQSLVSLPDYRIRIDPSWSPNSSRLVYRSTPRELGFQEIIYKDLYLLDVNTQQETNLIEFAAIGPPHWSPIEDVIAFSASTEDELFNSGEFNVYLINSDGTDLKKLTDNNSFNVSAWSPDGKKLALEFLAEYPVGDEIYVLDLETGQLDQITNNDVYDAFPIWIEF